MGEFSNKAFPTGDDLAIEMARTNCPGPPVGDGKKCMADPPCAATCAVYGSGENRALDVEYLEDKEPEIIFFDEGSLCLSGLGVGLGDAES